MTSDRILESALPGYDIGAELGRGSFGIVVAAQHRQLGRDCAVKFLSPQLVATDAVRARFHAEAQLLASIDHPHVIPVYDYIEHDGACILVMERLGGGTVWRRFVDQGFDLRNACAIALVACSGLDGAHRHGVLHRDMKPENVLFGSDRILKVGDFGIARVFGEDDALATTGGELLGTPAYMAPEQASGAALGPFTDVYATGVMLYELLSGKLPFSESGGSLAIVLRHVNEEPTALRDLAPSVPTAICEVVMRALARDPLDRYDSAAAFGEAIGEAASAVWGSGWLGETGIDLREAGLILAAAHRGGAGAGASSAREGDVVRPEIELHVGGGPPAGVALTDLLPLRSTPVDMPAPARRSLAASIALAAAALAIGLGGVGGAAPKASLPVGAVSVAGIDPAVAAVPVDLGRLVPIAVRHVPLDLGATVTARLTFDLAGIQVVSSTSTPLQLHSGALTGTVDASVGRYLVGGRLAATLQLTGARRVDDAFAARAARPTAATFGGITVIILVLVVGAYVESLLRTLRLGRRRDKRGAIAGLVVVGALGGLAAAMIGWLFNVASPGVLGVSIAALLGAASGSTAAIAARRAGERARAHRRANRLVLVARRTGATPRAAVR